MSTNSQEDSDTEEGCNKPCDPDLNCPHCEVYWERMSAEGFWDSAQHRWTERGWKEMMK